MAQTYQTQLILLGFISLFHLTESLNNGLALTPPMGWSTWNLYHRDFTSDVFIDAVQMFESTPMKRVGYEYINVDGGWWWSVNKTVYRNSSGYAYFDPIKYPTGIQSVVDYIHSHGLKYGHYTDAGTKACDGDTQMSEHYRAQDIALFISFGMDMIKVDACSVEGNDTQIMFDWRDDLNATGRPVLFSNCRNQCMSNNWQPWCVELSNMWRISKDITSTWEGMLYNLDATRSYGKYGQPGAWNDPDFLEVGIGEFAYDGTKKSVLINQAHFSLWCIISAPLIGGMDLTNMSNAILDIIVNEDAIRVNQNYLNNAGDVILEFDEITNDFRSQYIQQMAKNNNQTQLFYKPLPQSIGDAAAFVFLNRDTIKSYDVTLDFNQLPFVQDHGVNALCVSFDIWTKAVNISDTYRATLPPQSVKFILVSDCIFS